MFGFLYYFGKAYMNWEVELSIIMAIFFLIAFTRQQFFRFGLSIAELSEKLTYIQRYDEIVWEWQKQKKETGKHLDTLDTDIVFQDVDFRYDGQKELLFEKFNLSIHKWQKIAIMWRSGSGKSTIFKLITRMIESEKGVVNIVHKSKWIDIKKVSYEIIF